jgi:hypothetical protein
VSTDVDVSPVRPRPGRYVWLALALVVALGTLFVVYRAGVFGGQAGTDRPADLRTQLSARVINVLEQMPAEDHGHHGDVTADAAGAKLVCGVNVYGTNPADADSIDEVAQVYGYHMCATPQRGLEWILSYKLTGPLVVTLAADPPTVTVAEGGTGYRDRVRAIIPAQHQEKAYNGSLTAEDMAELIRRYDEAANA